MPLNRLLQVCVFMVFLIPLAGLSPSALLEAGHRAVLGELRDMLGTLDRDGRLGDGGRELLGLLSPSPQALRFTQENVDRNIRTAKRGYRLLRRVTRDGLMKNLVIRPAEAVARLGDAVAAELSHASLANLKRAWDDPLRLPPELEKLLRG